MRIIETFKKIFFLMCFGTIVVTIINAVTYESGNSSDSYTSNDYTTDDYTANDYTTDEYTTSDYTDNDYVEETQGYSDTHTTAPVSDPVVRGEGYLGAFVTADGSSDIYFYEYGGQRYYEGTIYGVYYSGTAEVYESHGAIYCYDGSKNDGTIAVSFYMSYDESNEMSPYELYEQAYGTGFYWHHQ